MKMALMMIFMLALLLGVNVYVFYRLWHLIPPVLPARIAVMALGVLCIACVVLYFVLVGKNTPHWLAATVYRIGTSYLIILLYLLIAFLLMDLVRLTGLVDMGWLTHGNWKAFGIFAAAITLLMVFGNVVYHNKKRVELDITTAKMPRTAAPVKIVAVSDMHLGYGIGNRELARWVGMINSEEPDLILIAGDMIDTHLRPLYEKDMAAHLRRLSAPMGVYAIPGNHEYISGIERGEEFYATTGITLLRDSVVAVGDDLLYIAGRDDKSNPARKSVAGLLEGKDAARPVILLDHQPDDLCPAAENDVTLQLSGHTHRGQVWPISWVTDALFEKSHGYTRRADTHYFISSGLGIWGGKFRIGTRSEYVVITLSSSAGV